MYKYHHACIRMAQLEGIFMGALGNGSRSSEETKELGSVLNDLSSDKLAEVSSRMAERGGFDIYGSRDLEEVDPKLDA
jgi:hypothetical protein